jgi:putative oxidoreductase
VSVVTRLIDLATPVTRSLDFLTPVLLFGTRLWVASVFFKSGLVKIQSFDTTIFLFQYEYQVPLLSPTMAAYMGTFTELFFPVLLALGFTGRFTAGVLFVFNVLAVVSYPALQPVGIKDHELWGFMLAVLVFFGPGKLSIDYFLLKKLGRG